MSSEPPRAVIYAPAGSSAQRWQQECSRHARAEGYRVVMVTADPAAVQLYLDERLAEIVLVGRDAHRRRLRVIPRIEAISDLR